MYFQTIVTDKSNAGCDILETNDDDDDLNISRLNIRSFALSHIPFCQIPLTFSRIWQIAWCGLKQKTFLLLS